ncbi:hypothetical protein FACS189421_11820 [Bacteroidia bacterium]|nr:hypothetical protein FACS189421_11820 [Bacteroidia bacterium]GHT05224.1 hypothetical protein FACS189423_09080 [Bacteroidia bacterium]GHT50007.1 hypothetical protein FACS189440_16680 [Bacteroidia bacterium]
MTGIKIEIDWDSKEIAQYKGKIVDVYVQIIGNRFLLLVDNKYPAMLPKKYFNRNKMEEGTIIQCQVISINTDFRYLKLRAANTVLHSHSILDKIDAATVEKLRKQYVSI